MGKRKTIDYKWQRWFPWNKDKLTLDEHKDLYGKNRRGRIGYRIGKEVILNPNKKIPSSSYFSLPRHDSLSFNVSAEMARKKWVDVSLYNNIKFISEETVLDYLRNKRSSKIVSNITNGLATFIVSKMLGGGISNHQMNILRGTIAFAASEVLNDIFSDPINIYNNIKTIYDDMQIYIQAGKLIFKAILWFNEKIGVLEFKERNVETVSPTSNEYNRFLKTYPKIANVYKSLSDKNIIGKTVSVVIDRPIDSIHPKNGTVYRLNYGFIPHVFSLDGEEQDAYIIDEDSEVKEYRGKVVAIIHRKDDIENKWVVSNKDRKYSIDEIRQATHFIEQYFDIEIEVN